MPPPLELKPYNRWCTCGHSEWRHHGITWSCLADGCHCDRFTWKEGDATSTLNTKMTSDAAPTVQPAGAADEWTTTAAKDADCAIVVGTKLIGVAATVSQAVNIVAAHNAALAAERAKHIVSEGLLTEANKEIRDFHSELQEQVATLVDALKEAIHFMRRAQADKTAKKFETLLAQWEKE